VGVALRAVADDGNLLALDDRQVSIIVVEDFGHFDFLFIFWVFVGAVSKRVLARHSTGDISS
jgi:hypothetical protein